MSHKIYAAVVLVLFSVAGCATCKSSKVVGGSGIDRARPASPVGHFDKQERMRRALEGLSFDSGLVEVDAQTALETPGHGDVELAKERCALAEEALGRNQRVVAIEMFKEAVLIAPELVEAYYGLGRALTAKSEIDCAIAAFRTAVKIDPTFLDARYQLAFTLAMKSRWGESIAQYRLLIEQDSRYPQAHSRLAIALYYNDDLESAREAMVEAAAVGDQVPPQFEALLDGETPQVRARGASWQVGDQVRIDTTGGTFAANETTVSASDANPMHVVGSWNDWRDSGANEVVRIGVAISLDGGETFSDFLVRPPLANQSGVEGDPMTCYDHRTGDLWVGGISFAANGGVFVARKRPGQPTFDDPVMARETGGADKGWMAAGPDPLSPGSTRVYTAYNEGVLISDDLGATWSAPTSLGVGIGFLPRVGPNGEVYVAYWNYGSGVKLKRSVTGGTSFSTMHIATRMDVWGTQDGSRFPGLFRSPSMSYLAVDPNSGVLYCVYSDTTNIVGGNSNVDLYFAKSTNMGSSWTAPVVINTDGDPPGDQFFPWIEVDRTGRLHLLFYDSRNVDQDDDDVNGWFDAYYSTSDDGGESWAEYRLTPSPFNSNDDGLDRPGEQFIGDYSGLAVAGKRVYACYLSTQNGDSDIFVNTIMFAGDGDFDDDGDVDLVDFAAFQACFDPAPTGLLEAECDTGDMNADDVVDLDDFTEFQARMLGPG